MPQDVQGRCYFPRYNLVGTGPTMRARSDPPVNPQGHRLPLQLSRTPLGWLASPELERTDRKLSV